MKLLSSLFIQIVVIVAATMMVTTVEGKTRAKGDKPTTTPGPTPTPRPTRTPAPTPSAAAGKASKKPISSSKSSKKPTTTTTNSSSGKASKITNKSFDTCSLANPPYEQAKILPGPSSLTLEQFLKNDLLGKGGVGYLVRHSSAVYAKFATWVEVWVKSPSDKTKVSIENDGKKAGALHTSLSLSATVQCDMMKALVGQMKPSCNYYDKDGGGGMEVYVQVASAYMNGFNQSAGASGKKEDFVAYCGSLEKSKIIFKN